MLQKHKNMKEIILVYANFEEYSRAYTRYESAGFDVAVVVGMEYAISIDGDKVAWVDIVCNNM